MPAITVILPTRDRSGLLPRAVSSVLEQTERSWELLIIDNNVREPPIQRSLGSAMWRDDPRVTVLRPEIARNAAVARNAGLAAAKGRWVTYLDDDDAYRPGKLAAQLALAESTSAPLVLCGAVFNLRGRCRTVQCETKAWRGDQLILRARWNTPLLFHRRAGGERFDEALSSGEDAEFAHRLVCHAGGDSVPVAALPLVDIFPQPGPRVNADPAPMRAVAARILALRPGFFSRNARRRYLLQTLLGMAKLNRRPCGCAILGWRLWIESRGEDWRPAANALAVSLGAFRGRWVS